jgi:hypothetical protein
MAIVIDAGRRRGPSRTWSPFSVMDFIVQSLRGKGMGEHLLMDALRRALDASREAASVAVVVDAKDDAAVAFYRRYEFIPFAELRARLFLPMGTIERLFA